MKNCKKTSFGNPGFQGLIFVLVSFKISRKGQKKRKFTNRSFIRRTLYCSSRDNIVHDHARYRSCACFNGPCTVHLHRARFTNRSMKSSKSVRIRTMRVVGNDFQVLLPISPPTSVIKKKKNSSINVNTRELLESVVKGVFVVLLVVIARNFFSLVNFRSRSSFQFFFFFFKI